MTDSDSDNSPGREEVSKTDFSQILAIFSPDVEEAARRYNRLHEKLTGYFSLKSLSDPGSVADETIDRAVSKIGAGAIVPDVNKYCFGIARNLVRERLRINQHENRAFRQFIEDLNNSSTEHLERINRILKPCFEQLAVKEQQLLAAYCKDLKGQARAEYRRRLAEELKMTLLALRIKVTRLRDRLADCARKRSNGVETLL